MNKPIFSKAIKELLEQKGFRPVDARMDYRHPNRTVYFFEATPEFLAAFDAILSGRQA